MSWLLEQPLPIAAMGGLLTVMLVSGLYKTGHRGLLGAAICVVMLTIGLLMLERFVVTPGEQVAATLEQMADDLQSNQPAQVLQHISSGADQLRQNAATAMKRIEIHEANVKSNLETEIAADGNTAVARFNATFEASDRSGLVAHQRAAWFFVVDFVREDGQWRVTDYKRYDPLDRDAELAAHEM